MARHAGCLCQLVETLDRLRRQLHSNSSRLSLRSHNGKRNLAQRDGSRKRRKTNIPQQITFSISIVLI
jgi:hypothetical protein